MTKLLRVTCSVTTANEEVVARSAEALARAITGLAFEDGVEVFLSIAPDDEEDAA